jgi:hypothetical protein
MSRQFLVGVHRPFEGTLDGTTRSFQTLSGIPSSCIAIDNRRTFRGAR